MIVKFLGGLDIFAAVIVILFQFRIIHGPLIFSLGLYLIFKAVIFFGDLFSIIDGVIGLYMLLMMLVSIEWLSIICASYLVIKGFTSTF